MGKAENDGGAGGWSSDKWVECYDPIVEETYYYCHATKESTYDPPDDYITANEDPIIKSVIKIQCLGRKRLAEHKVQRVRYHKYKDVAFNNDFCSGPAEVLSGGMAVRKPARSPGKDKPLTCFVGTKTMSFGKHYFMFQVSKLASSSAHECQVGVCPYVKPARIPSLKKPLKEMAGSWAVTSTGDVYKNGAKVPADWMEPFGQGDTIGLVLDYDEHKIGISRNAMFLGDLSLKGTIRTDLVAALTVWEAGDEVGFHWLDKPPHDLLFSQDSLSSNESVEAILQRYKKKPGGKKGAEEDELPPLDSTQAVESEEDLLAPPKPRPMLSVSFGITEQYLGEAAAQLEGLLQRHGAATQAVAQVRSKAVALKTKLEQDAKRREVEERKAKVERKKALHRLPDSRERKEFERRNRKKYMAIQIDRYNTARKRFLAGVESERQAEAQFFEAQAAARKEAQRLKKEREEQRHAELAGKAETMFDACKSGMPVWRLQELVGEEVQRVERRCPHPLQVFERFCGSVEVGYVLESSHPYSSEPIDQCVEVHLEEAAGRGVCVAFDPRSDTRAGEGHISFLLEREKAAAATTSSLTGTLPPPSQPIPEEEGGGGEGSRVSDVFSGGGIVGITGASPLFRGQGLDLNLCTAASYRDAGTPPLPADAHLPFLVGPPPSAGSASSGTASSSDPGSVPGTAEPVPLPLPGVGKSAPLFLSTNRFVIRFKASAHDLCESAGSWGWRLVVFAAESQEHGQALMDRSVHNANILRVLNHRRNPQGDTALHVAAWEGNVAAISYLVAEGANLHVIDSARTKVTPLHLAARAGHLGAVKRLLELGADFLCKTNIGDTPLHYACRAGHIRVARRLVKAERKELLAVKSKNQRGHWPHEVVPRQHCHLLYEMMKDFFEGRRRKPRKRNRHVIGG